MRLAGLAAALLFSATAAIAAPKVAADIAPVHSLVAAVMRGVGEPTLILPPGASPHGYALRPSEARAVQEADLVVWIGPELTPWLDGPIDALAGRARNLPLRKAPGVTLLPVRGGATFEANDHDHGAAHDHGQDHAEAAAHDHDHDHDHAPAEAAAHDHDQDHAKAAGDDHAQPQGATDEHIWLDPENAKAFLTAIAAALAEIDPGDAATYAANAKAAAAAIDAASVEVAATLAPVKGAPYVVFHDAFQYFEARFGVPASGAVTLSDATAPSAARVAEVRELLEQVEAVCVFAEPQFPARVIDAIAEGTTARAGVLDPLGATLTPGPDLYPALLRGLAAALADCRA